MSLIHNKPPNISKEIQRQSKAEGERRDPISPIEHPVGLARVHTPIYTMHRYFARRPWNVFEFLIKHYSRPGDIVYDPFCGGGVAVVEALRLRRKAIGVDLNPLATFITRMEVLNIDIPHLEEAFLKIKEAVQDEIVDLYHTTCPRCQSKEAYANWFKWSQVLICPGCSKSVILDKAKKLGPGRYSCPNPKCKSLIIPSECTHVKNELVQVYYLCPSGHNGIKRVSPVDLSLVERIEKGLKTYLAKRKLTYPVDGFPDGDLEKDHSLFKKGVSHFYNLFTKRSLLANVLLKNAIISADLSPEQKDLMLFAFSASLSWTSVLTSETGHGWQHHAYWIPNIFYEMNVWDMFNKRYQGGAHTILRGKQYSAQEIGSFCHFGDKFEDLRQDATCLLLAQSAHKVPFPPKSVDVIITDPPFGGNVQYAELSDFWAVWLKETLGLKGVIDTSYEAIQTRHTGFATEKSSSHYEEMLFKVFKECHRVLKKDGHMVLTFHNRDIGVWMSLHRAARRAGFRLPTHAENPTRGMIYQPPIEHYTATLHQRAAGSMLGDFILTFVRMDELPDVGKIKEALTPEEERDLVNNITQTIEYHGGADENTLMTVLIPYLSEKGLLYRLAHLDIRSLLSERFKFHQGKWYKPEMLEQDGRSLRPIDIIPSEHVTQELILNFLKGKKYATLDELLVMIYTTLVNSDRPGIQTINRVMNRVGRQIRLPGQKRIGFALKPDAPLSPIAKESKLKTQTNMFGEAVALTIADHNELIKNLASMANQAGYEVHVGETEQRKVPYFREISRIMNSPTEFGIPAGVFDIIKEIDLLVLKGYVTLAAFEVATSVETAQKAINVRFRNLFEAAPSMGIKAFVLVNDQDYKKASEMLFTLANIRDSLSKKVRLLRTSEVDKVNFLEI